MAELKDSGARRGFDSGAVRDIAEGKGRADLLPLKVVSSLLDDDTVLVFIEEYIRTGRIEHLRSAIRSFAIAYFTDVPTAMLETSKQYEDGAKKYSDRNWEKGMPVHCYIDSGVRHYLKVLRGDTDEPHDRAFVWNMLGAIWTHVNRPDLRDLPFADKSPDPCAGVTDAMLGKYSRDEFPNLDWEGKELKAYQGKVGISKGDPGPESAILVLQEPGASCGKSNILPCGVEDEGDCKDCGYACKQE